MERHFDQHYDNHGAMARTGLINKSLLQKLLSHDYFDLPAPKSTGREVFNSQWLATQNSDSVDGLTLLTTVTELTAITMADAIKQTGVNEGGLLICGGGSHNDFLLERLQHHCKNWRVTTTLSAGFDPDWIEAAAFGWLARQRWHQLPGNLTSVTGARRETILGAVYLP